MQLDECKMSTEGYILYESRMNVIAKVGSSISWDYYLLNQQTSNYHTLRKPDLRIWKWHIINHQDHSLSFPHCTHIQKSTYCDVHSLEQWADILTGNTCVRILKENFSGLGWNWEDLTGLERTLVVFQVLQWTLRGTERTWDDLWWFESTSQDKKCGILDLVQGLGRGLKEWDNKQTPSTYCE